MRQALALSGSFGLAILGVLKQSKTDQHGEASEREQKATITSLSISRCKSQRSVAHFAEWRSTPTRCRGFPGLAR